MPGYAVPFSTAATGAVAELPTGGGHVSDAGLARLSPVGFDHIRMIGWYSFHFAPELAAGRLRPLKPARRRPVPRTAKRQRTSSWESSLALAIRRNPNPPGRVRRKEMRRMIKSCSADQEDDGERILVDHVRVDGRIRIRR